MCRIFINTSDIAALEGISKQRASEVKQLIMDVYKKQKPNKLTIDEYCEYRGIKPETVKNQMK